jgi:probable HAF family extracellular repeat protein
MTNRFVRPAVAVAASLVYCNLFAAGFFPLGDLPGGTFNSRALGISSDGSTVVGRANSATGDEAFIWTSGPGMQGLGYLPGGSSPSFANAASSDGTVVVGQSSIGIDFEAFTSTNGGSMVGLGFLLGGSLPSNAYAVSGDGSTVVGGSVSASGPEAFVWTSGGGMVGLGDLAGGLYDSVATGVSSDGATVAGAGQSASGVEAFIWTSGGGLMGLGDLSGGGFYSRANAISGDGTTVVGTSSGSFNPLFEAFVWTSAVGIQPLGVLPGSSQSDAFAVSGDGSAVVGTSISSPDEAFGVTIASGWTLEHAYGISADGSSIVGDGTNPDGDTEAWMMTLPDTDADGRPDYIDNCPNVQNTATFPDSEGWDPQQDDDGDNIGNACDLVIPPQPVPAARVGNFYSHQLTVLRGQPPNTCTLISGFLPSSLILTSLCVIEGNVTSGGFTATFTVQAMDANGDTATRLLKIRAKIPNCVNCHTAVGP